MFWIISLIFFLICPILYLAFSNTNFDPKNFRAYQFSIGLSILVFIGTVDGYFGFSTGWLSTFVLFTLVIMALYRLKRKSMDFFFSKSYQRLIFYYISLTALVFGINPRMFQFVNPDPYGYAAVSGFMDRYGGLKNSLNKSTELTGAKLTSGLNWDQPLNFPKIGSPWNLPDLVDKYGLSNGWIHHNGMSYVFYPFKNLVPEVSGFFTIWLVIAVLSIILIASMLCEISLFTTNIYYKNKSNIKTNKNNFKKTINTSNENILNILNNNYTVIVIEVLFLILLINSPVSSMFLLDGFSNQLLSFVFICAIIPVLITKHRNKFKFITAGILVLGTLFVYAQHITYTILVCGIYIIINFALKIWSKNKKYFFGSFLLALVLTPIILMLTPSFNLLIKYFFKSGIGGANHLGPVSYFQSLGVDPFFIGTYSNPLNFDFTNRIVEHQWAGLLSAPVLMVLREQGVSYFSTPAITLLFQALLLIILAIIVLIKFNSKEIFFIVSINILLIGLTVLYLCIQTSDYIIRNSDAGFNDYFWMRLLFPLQITFSPIFGIIFIAVIIKLNLVFSQIKSKQLITIFLIPFVLLSFSRAHVNYNVIQQYGKPASVTEKCPPKDFFDNRVFLLESITPFLGLALCSNPIIVVNDTFPVKQKVLGGTNLFYIRYDRVLKEYVYRLIGVFKVETSFNSPCDTSCLGEINGFQGLNSKEIIINY